MTVDEQIICKKKASGKRQTEIEQYWIVITVAYQSNYVGLVELASNLKYFILFNSETIAGQPKYSHQYTRKQDGIALILGCLVTYLIT